MDHGYFQVSEVAMAKDLTLSDSLHIRHSPDIGLWQLRDIVCLDIHLERAPRRFQ